MLQLKSPYKDGTTHIVMSPLEFMRRLAALVPRDAAGSERLVAQMLEQLEQGGTARVMARLASAWARGDLAEIEDYERWCECVADAGERAQMQRLNDDRNPALADGIEALHRAGRRVFAAVGALHMTGQQGLPRLMAARGYTVQRLVPP